ncbi:hypothetical protein [Saccharothrix yanglingensis]|uniref:hypothetical protein n=1 Tax=Saccharothrix yanglingensis TaxID=659496 RepID=UPI0027D23BFE|nr:hypothetical protein [Saccharothrix yanglingensis]
MRGKRSTSTRPPTRLAAPATAPAVAHPDANPTRFDAVVWPSTTGDVLDDVTSTDPARPGAGAHRPPGPR